MFLSFSPLWVTKQRGEILQGQIVTGMIVKAPVDITYPLPGPGFQTLGAAGLGALLLLSQVSAVLES